MLCLCEYLTEERLCYLLLLVDAQEGLLGEVEAEEEDHPYHQVVAVEEEEVEEASRR